MTQASPVTGFRGVLIGCGFFADNHLRAWHEIEGATIVAVCDRDRGKAEAAALKHGIARIYDDAEAMLVSLAGPAGIASTPGDELALWIQSEAMGRYGISIGGGTNEVQRNNLAERALGLPKEMRNDHQIAWKDVPRS